MSPMGAVEDDDEEEATVMQQAPAWALEDDDGGVGYERTLAIEGLGPPSSPGLDLGDANGEVPRTVALPSGDYPALVPGAGPLPHAPSMPKTMALEGAAAAAHFSSPAAPPAPVAQADDSGSVLKALLIGVALFVVMATAAGAGVFLLLR